MSTGSRARCCSSVADSLRTRSRATVAHAHRAATRQDDIDARVRGTVLSQFSSHGSQGPDYQGGVLCRARFHVRFAPSATRQNPSAVISDVAGLNRLYLVSQPSRTWRTLGRFW